MSSSSCGVLVSAGTSHTCVLFQDTQNVICWGGNQYGQLGLGHESVDPHTTPGNFVYLAHLTSPGGFVNMGTDRRVVSLSVAKEFVCAILDNRSVKCFGRNSYGQLGYGDTEHRGDAAGSMGDNLPSVDFGTGRYAVRLFPSSGEAMCALLNTAEVKCWGRNANYVLGMGIAEERNIGDNANEMGDNLVAISIPLGKMVINLWVANHVIVLLDDHTITGWGVLFDNGDVVGFGTNIEGSLGNVVGGRDQAALLNFGTGVRVKGLARNTFDSRCVVLGSNEVKCWGLNTDGQLGVGDTMTRGMDASHMGDTLPVVHL
ncbi:regulator of chromosome condensation 1/beta-lactamase-inhibitor protein II, partial [Baffinella frigidus]